MSTTPGPKTKNRRLNPRTEELLRKLKSEGADPAKFLIQVMDDTLYSNSEPHPLLLVMRDLNETRDGAPPTKRQWNNLMGMVMSAIRHKHMMQEIPLSDRITAAMRLAEHVYPKLRSAEIAADVDMTVKTPVINFNAPMDPTVESLFENLQFKVMDDNGNLRTAKPVPQGNVIDLHPEKK